MLSFTRIQHVAIGLMLIVLIVLSAVSLQTLFRVDDAIRNRLIKQQQVVACMADIALGFTQAQSAFKDIQIGTTTSPQKVSHCLDRIDQVVAKLNGFTTDPQFDAHNDVTLFRRETKRFRTALNAYIAAIQDDPSSDYVCESLARIDQLIATVVKNATVRHRHLSKMREDTLGKLLAELDHRFRFMMIMIMVGVSVAIGVSFWLTSRLRNRVEDILEVTQLLGQGALSCRLYSPHTDSLGKLCNGIDLMAQCLEQSEARLYESMAQLKHSNEVKSDFIANMSHEIRTPMTAILGFADMVYEETTDMQSKDKLKVIQSNGRYLLNIINDILDLSKIEADKLAVEQLYIDPMTLVEDVIVLFRPRCAELGLKLQLIYETSLPQNIRTDPTRLRQIFNNLLSNAVKFTQEGSITVKVGMIQVQRQWQFRVQVIDTGIGMQQAQLEKIFDAFSQADSSTSRKYGGTGLGMTISRKLSRLLGGDLVVSSKAGKGTKFTMTINPGPLHETYVAASHHAIVPSSQPQPDGDTRSQKRTKPLEDVRVLFVEDGPDNQILIKHLLSKAGAQVSLADNGQIALDQISNQEQLAYDVILMDMQMPVLDGYQATKRLREMGYTLPIIAVTANAMTGDRQKCTDAGCDDFIAKPVNRQLLIKTICKHLERTGPAPVASQ